MRYREIDGMYYVGDIVDVDGDKWVDKELFEILLREYQFELKELKRAMSKYLKKLVLLFFFVFE